MGLEKFIILSTIRLLGVVHVVPLGDITTTTRLVGPVPDEL